MLGLVLIMGRKRNGFFNGNGVNGLGDEGIDEEGLGSGEGFGGGGSGVRAGNGVAQLPMAIRKGAPRHLRIRAIDVGIPRAIRRRWTPAERRGGIILGPERVRIRRTIGGVELTEV